MTAQDLRAEVVAQARSWVGLKEADGSHRDIINIYNAIRPLPRGYRMSYSDPWCAAFVSAVGARCAMTAVILPECSCDAMIALYKARGRWAEEDNSPAKPGDLIFYDWDDSGVGDCTGSADHVGIIVEESGYYYKIVEGNKNDAVGYRTIAKDSRFIRGFALPDYAAQAADDDLAEPEPDVPAESDEMGFTLHFRVLNTGCKGEDVRAVQRTLKALGFDVGRWGLDGEFGNDTKAAVVAYQRSVNLKPDGEVGPDVLSRLMGVDA